MIMRFPELIALAYLNNTGEHNHDMIYVPVDGFEVLINGNPISDIRVYMGGESTTFLVTRKYADEENRHYTRYYRNEKLNVAVFKITRTEVIS